jgi:hypothetical protein
MQSPPVGIAQIAVSMPASRGLGDAFGIVVPRTTVGAALDQRLRRRDPRAAEAEERDRLPRRTRRDQGRYLSLSVDRPIRARITATIQKRITTWLSVQPSFSK